MNSIRLNVIYAQLDGVFVWHHYQPSLSHDCMFHDIPSQFANTFVSHPQVCLWNSNGSVPEVIFPDKMRQGEMSLCKLQHIHDSFHQI